jgi:hypothetical protein
MIFRGECLHGSECSGRRPKCEPALGASPRIPAPPFDFPSAGIDQLFYAFDLTHRAYECERSNPGARKCFLYAAGRGEEGSTFGDYIIDE